MFVLSESPYEMHITLAHYCSISNEHLKFLLILLASCLVTTKKANEDRNQEVGILNCKWEKSALNISLPKANFGVYYPCIEPYNNTHLQTCSKFLVLLINLSLVVKMIINSFLHGSDLTIVWDICQKDSEADGQLLRSTSLDRWPNTFFDTCVSFSFFSLVVKLMYVPSPSQHK